MVRVLREALPYALAAAARGREARHFMVIGALIVIPLRNGTPSHESGADPLRVPIKTSGYVGSFLTIWTGTTKRVVTLAPVPVLKVHHREDICCAGKTPMMSGPLSVRCAAVDFR